MKKVLEKKYFLLLLSILFWLMLIFTSYTDTSNDDYLYTAGNKIFDKSNREVRLTGVNFFGFETETKAFDGLWSRNMIDILNQTASLGFNILRVPISVQLITDWRKGIFPVPDSINLFENPELSGLNSLQIFDMAVEHAGKTGMKILLDVHRIINTNKTNLWYTGNYTTSDFINAWKWMVNRYKDTDIIIAADIFNEPHGKPWVQDITECAKWDGTRDSNNFKHLVETVAEEILSINPELIIFVEGIEAYPKTGFTYESKNEEDYYHNWWGGNLRGAKEFPIDLGYFQNKRVYEPHDYGPSVYEQPWFYEGFNYDTLMEDCWYDNWFYLYDSATSPILFGEWGGWIDGPENVRTLTWMTALRRLIKENDLHFTFWCLNSNSHDTGGILTNDYMDVDQIKYEFVADVLWKDKEGRFIGLDHETLLNSLSDDYPQNGINVSIYYDGPTDSSPPTVPPTPLPVSKYYGEIIALYECGDANPTTMEIKPYISIINETADMAFDLEEISIRYYYAKEGTLAEEGYFDYAVIGEDLLAVDFFNGYMEIGFQNDAGSLTPGSGTGEILMRFNKTNYSIYDQSNDYSFDPTKTDYEPWEKIAVFYNGLLAWGKPPGAIIYEEEETPTPTTAMPGDVNGDEKVNIVDALMIAQYTVGLSPEGFLHDRADVDNSGAISIIDALMVAQAYVGLIELPD